MGDIGGLEPLRLGAGGRLAVVARVEWTRIEPGDIEQVVSVLLCRENPVAVRTARRAATGGIDVLVPPEGNAGVAV